MTRFLLSVLGYVALVAFGLTAFAALLGALERIL